MAVAFCNKKKRAELELILTLKKNKKKKTAKKQNKNTFCAPTSVGRVVPRPPLPPQQGVRRAGGAAQSYCSMLLIVLLVDSSFRCLVVYLQGEGKCMDFTGHDFSAPYFTSCHLKSSQHTARVELLESHQQNHDIRSKYLFVFSIYVTYICFYILANKIQTHAVYFYST